MLAPLALAARPMPRSLASRARCRSTTCLRPCRSFVNVFLATFDWRACVLIAVNVIVAGSDLSAVRADVRTIEERAEHPGADDDRRDRRRTRVARRCARPPKRALPRLTLEDPRRRASECACSKRFSPKGSPRATSPERPATATTTPRATRYESLLARVFRAERVLARLSIVSGTHAIVAALDALVEPGARLLCANGAPYDTLRHALVDAPYSLVARGVDYAEVPRTIAGDDRSRRSRPLCGRRRRSRSCSARAGMPRAVRSRSTRSDDRRRRARETPPRRRLRRQLLRRAGRRARTARSRRRRDRRLADQELGGGLAPTGGYIAGRAELIERIAARVFAPGSAPGSGRPSASGAR